MNQNLLVRVLNLRLRRGNWALNVRGNLELHGALISNHQISICSLFAFRVKICWWVFAIWGFEGGIGPPTFRGPQNFTGALISNHQTSKFGLLCLKNENLLVGVCNLRFRRWNWTLNMWGTSKFCTWAPIWNHQTFIFSKFGSMSDHYYSGFWIWGLDGSIGPQNSTGAPTSNIQIPKFSDFGSRNQMFLWVFWILGFEGGIGLPTHGGPHYSTAAPVLNHQASNFNHSDSKSQYFWWAFWILGFEGGIGPPTHGGIHYSTKALVSNHQTFKFRHFGSWVLPIRKFKV
jgi:hypothetical protein